MNKPAGVEKQLLVPFAQSDPYWEVPEEQPPGDDGPEEHHGTKETAELTDEDGIRSGVPPNAGTVQ